MVNYEVTFIVDPVLSGDEIKATAQTYIELLKNEGCNIVYVNEMGLRQLAYEINRRQSGVYYCVEFETEQGDFLSNMELSLRRDERIMRFLTVRLDKFGVKYNADKRSGLIGKKKTEKKREETTEREPSRDRNDRDRNAPAPKQEAAASKQEKAPAPKQEVAPKQEEAPVTAVTEAPEAPAPKQEAAAPKQEETPDTDATETPEVPAETTATEE